ncbi:MAG: hypothetical protein WEA29_09800 [Acidimicrobiia bacterium]
MALVACEECGAEVSTRAEACPRCGAALVAQKLSMDERRQILDEHAATLLGDRNGVVNRVSADEAIVEIKIFPKKYFRVTVGPTGEVMSVDVTTEVKRGRYRH